ncbi:hypothetical protein ScPMuIL_006085 [Solemya velum]
METVSTVRATEPLPLYSDTTARELMKRLYDLQEERVQTYKLFEEGFQAYLKGSPNYNFNMYRQLVHEITQTFNKISQDILAVQIALSERHNMSTVASLISKIQEEEKTKLELTAKLQISRQNNIDHPAEELHSQEITATKQRIQEVVDHIVELLEELKYETEDLYLEDGSKVPEIDR